MKMKLLWTNVLALMLGLMSYGQSTINITTAVNTCCATEKWVSITDMTNGTGTQIWGQGNGTYGNGQGIINQDIVLPAGTYWVNCYDRYDDSWDGTTIDVTAYGVSLGNNGGVSPDDGNDTDGNSNWETPADELEASFMIVVPVPPSCLAPTSALLTSTTDVTASFSWTDALTEDAGYNWEVVPQGDAPGTNVVANGTTAAQAVTLTAAGLTPDTNYDFYIQSVCGTGTSNFTSPVTFKTRCAAVTDFNENFDAVSTPNLPNCWSVIVNELATGTDPAVTSSTAADNSAPNGARLYNGSGDLTTPNDVYLISPAVSTLNTGTHRLKFFADGSPAGDVEVGTMSNPEDAASFTLLETVSFTTTFVEYVVDLSGYTGTDQYIAFKHPNTTTFDSIYLDDIVLEAIPACLDATDFALDSITDSVASLSWTNNAGASASSILYGLSGFDPLTAGTTVAGGANTASVTGLTPETAYDFYVIQDCNATGDGLSPISASVSGTTLCATLVPDVLETFDAFLPNCWVEASNGDLTTGPTGLGSGDWSVDEFAHLSTSGGGGANINLFNANTSDWILSPLFDLSAGGYEVNIDVAVTDYNSAAADMMGSDDEVILAYTLDGVTWTALQTWTMANQPATAGETFTADISTITGSTVQFGMYATEGAVDDTVDYDFHFDNFQVRTIPTCPDTANLTLVSQTDVQATINFDSGNATSVGNYEYSLTPDATTAPAMTGAWTDVAGATPNVTYSITGLTAETTYFIHVREICGPGNFGPWSLVPISVTTECAVIVPDSLESFDTFVPNCWKEATNGDLTTGPTGIGSGDWSVEEFAHLSASGGGAANINLYRNVASDWILSPLYDMSAGGYEVNIDVAVTNFNSTAADTMGSDDEVILAYTLDGVTWTAIQTWTMANQPATAGETFNADLSTITGSTVQFGILASDGAIDDAGIDYDFHIDNFQIRTIPTCKRPNNLQIVSSTQTTVDITMDSNNISSAGNFEYLLDTANSYPTGPDGSVAATGTFTGVTGTISPIAQSTQIMGLIANTGYDLYVREVCSATDSSFWSPVLAFRTACDAITDFNENFDGVSTPDLPFCWSSFATDLATGTDPYVRTTTAGDNSAPNGVQLYSGDADGTTVTADVLLISPLLSNLSAGTHRVKFYANVTDVASTVEVGTITDPNDPATFTVLGTFNPTTTHAEYIQNFDTYTGTDTYIAFKHVFSSVLDNLYLDDIVWEVIPPCQDPTNLALLSSTDTSVSLTWTNNDGAATSSILYGPVGFDPLTAGTTVVGGPDNATVTGLTPETDYDFYVIQDCSATGDGLSNAVGPINAVTPCSAIAAPYLVDFESFTAAPSGFETDQCWNELSTGAYDWAIDDNGGTVSTNTGPDAAFSGTTYMFVESSDGSDGDVATVRTQAVDLAALAAPSLSFYYHMYGDFITDLVVAVSSDNGATFTNELTITGQQQTSSSDPWLQSIIDLSAYANQTIIVSFTTVKGTGSLSFRGDLAIDDVNFYDAAVCNDVTMVAIDSVTPDSITVSWTENSVPLATAWEVIAVATGGTAPVVGTTNATTNPFTIPSLSATTAYDIYVRSDCATTFVGPISATTTCAVVSMFPATTDFTNNTPNSCWGEAGDGEITAGAMASGASNWRSGRAYTTSTGTVVPSNAINLFDASNREWLISESYDLSSLTTKILTIEVALTNYLASGSSIATDVATMGSDDEVNLIVTTDAGLTWTVLQTWNQGTEPVATGERSYIDLAAYSGTVQFAFHASDGIVDDTESYDFHVGAFIIDATAGNNDVDLQNVISLYPNPVNGDTMTINMGNNTSVSQTSIIIYNTLGQEVMYRDFDNVTNNTIVMDNLSSLTSGVYLVHISNGSSTAVKRFIKQ